ncbi:MAG: 2-C-methyl-D-erythritol 2,4-cyclodiphosphate synthase, partial [Rhizobiaceae bacterium]|nr:2-C-methyl-D-erythritol 2,4-cyclodiphosphate synthase [Rhizobiaceae bacterium]
SVGPGVGALPAMPVADTLKRSASDGTIAETVDRTSLFGAQTPQGFLFGEIRDAHRAAASAGRADFTDDAAIAEWAGMTVRLVEGSPDNLKLTRADDIQRADRSLARVPAMIDVRTGNGYDVHQLVPGDHVTLCGVRIAHDRTLSGHSDADVGLHALTDALLATCGAGDIGDHFPPSDPQWRGAASHIFVRHAVALVTRHGGRLCNADVTLISEAPKIAPHREAMRMAIADMTGLALERVSVKATTNETIGFVGRREGIAAIATASVVYGDGA